MSGDEIVVLIVTLALSFVVWIPWVLDNARIGHPRHGAVRSWLYVAPLAAGAVLASVLRSFASFDVRGDPVYIAFYMSMGCAWVGLAVGVVLPYFGLSARDDVLERGNAAAAYAICGALLGLTLCFAGGNIGDGPGWWVVVLSGLLSTGTFFLSWFFLDKLTHLADVVTIDRDPAAGVRLSGFFAGSGLILGRAVAGNWTWLGATVFDFARLGWPMLLLFALAAFLERHTGTPQLERPFEAVVSQGVLPAMVYLSLAGAVVLFHGSWN